VCVLEGVADFQAGEHVITCNEKHFILFPPQTPLTFSDHLPDKTSFNQESSCTIVDINLYKDSIYCMVHHSKRGKMSGDPANGLIRHPQSVRAFKMLTEELLSDHETDFTIARHLLSVLFLSMSREIEAGHELSLVNGVVKSSPPESVQEIRDYVKAHLHEGLTIEKVAREMFMSPSTFTQYLRKESGQTFVEMLTEYRIAEADYLLRETKWTIAIISKQLGFSSSTYFSAFFFRHTGFSPGVYRLKSPELKNQRKA
jgi:AraC-like DNA-binding protein